MILVADGHVLRRGTRPGRRVRDGGFFV